MDWEIKNSKGIKGEITVPPDKSISHRAVMLGAISSGNVKIENFLKGEDCMHTLEAFRSLGVDIDMTGSNVVVHGAGKNGLRPQKEGIYLGNSGTSMRIISGILAGQNFETLLRGDDSLSKRPMNRVLDPLKEMGVCIDFLAEEGYSPFKIKGAEGPLKPISYTSPVASAQVKSCVLCAGLYADGITSVTEPFQSRDHTERMLRLFNADISCKGLTTEIKGGKELKPCDIVVPGDISSAAFFIISALLVEGSRLKLKDVGLNPTRVGLLNVLKRMDADIEVIDRIDDVEPRGDLEIKHSALKGAIVSAEEIPLLIDEVPVLVVAASMAEGETILKGVSELKVKETDRVKSIRMNMAKLGVEIFEKGDDLVIPGGISRFGKDARLPSFGDHRTAMSMAVASLVSAGSNTVLDVDCISTSYPQFIEDLNKISY